MPLLVASAWRGRERRAVTGRTARVAAAAIVAVPLIGYPLVVGADGARFPSPATASAERRPGETAALDLVFGRRDTTAEAEQLLERVRGVGYVDAEVRADGCGRWKVVYDGIDVVRPGRQLGRRGAWRRTRGVARDRASWLMPSRRRTMCRS